MHLKPGHVIDIGDREGIVLFNSTIKEKECIVVTFEDKTETIKLTAYDGH